MSLFRIEEELRRSKTEVCSMKVDIEEKEGRWWEEKQRAEKEKLELIKVRITKTPIKLGTIYNWEETY